MCQKYGHLTHSEWIWKSKWAPAVLSNFRGCLIRWLQLGSVLPVPIHEDNLKPKLVQCYEESWLSVGFDKCVKVPMVQHKYRLVNLHSYYNQNCYMFEKDLIVCLVSLETMGLCPCFLLAAQPLLSERDGNSRSEILCHAFSIYHRKDF